VSIPFERGLDGWSDADAAVHAIIDALCGAGGLGDIGTQFPPGDERFHGASSLVLLEQVRTLLEARGLKVVNVDVTIVAEEPRLSPYVGEMRRCLATAMDLAVDCIAVKAKTNEHMGFIGRGEGMAAFAVALLSHVG